MDEKIPPTPGNDAIQGHPDYREKRRTATNSPKTLADGTVRFTWPGTHLIAKKGQSPESGRQVDPRRYYRLSPGGRRHETAIS